MLLNLVTPEITEYIGDYSFFPCFLLAGELVLRSNIKTIGDSSFYGCANLIGNLVIYEKVTSVGVSCFMNCQNIDDDSAYFGIINKMDLVVHENPISLGLTP